MEHKCNNFANPVGYIELFVILICCATIWKLVELLVRKRYSFLNETRRRKVHHAMISCGSRVLLFIWLNILLVGPNITYQWYVNLTNIKCWVFTGTCYLLSAVGISNIFQLFFGVAYTIEYIIHHSILIVAIIGWVNNPDPDDKIQGYYCLVSEAYCTAGFGHYFAIEYHLQMHNVETVGGKENVIKTYKAMWIRRAILLFNFIVILDVFAVYWLIQVLILDNQSDTK
eukprot:UN11853